MTPQQIKDKVFQQIKIDKIELKELMEIKAQKT